ncbi:MAG: dethiobiotin synthase [Alphaproteobacteria bacterium]|nr:dethiobiotin synthase [Alphaproteobacteria bacterium]
MAIFVTATGTDVGKTYVTCALIREAKRIGLSVRAYKPVISGFNEADAQESDTGRILHALGRKCDRASIQDLSPWRFAAALSAEMAAEREGRVVPFDDVAAFCREVAARTSDLCLIEGVGGLMSPIDTRRTNLDLIVASDARPLLVAGSYLGTISHTLTALAALKAARLEPIAVVISESDASPVPMSELIERLGAFARVPLFGIGRDQGAPRALLDLIVKA